MNPLRMMNMMHTILSKLKTFFEHFMNEFFQNFIPIRICSDIFHVWMTHMLFQFYFARLSFPTKFEFTYLKIPYKCWLETFLPIPMLALSSNYDITTWKTFLITDHLWGEYTRQYWMLILMPARTNCWINS